MKTKPFNLEEAQKGAKLVNRNHTEILWWHYVPTIMNSFPILAQVKGDRGITSYTIQGNYTDLHEHPRDLLLVAETKLRPWKPEEIPVGALLRPLPINPVNWDMFLITARSSILAKGYIIYGTRSEYIDVERLIGQFEHSTDNGETWKPCGVEE